MKYFKKRKLRQFISILLVAALTSVSISGCTYPTKTDGFAKGSKKENESTAINYEVSKLRNVDEIKLAKTETDAGKISEHLQDGYQKLKNAIENLDKHTEAIDDFSVLISELKSQTKAKLKEKDTNVNAYKEYYNSVLSGFEQLEEIIADWNSQDEAASLQKIENLVVTDKPNIILGEELPIQNTAWEDVALEENREEKYEEYIPENNDFTKNDLLQTNDTIINEEIRTEFAALKRPLEMYLYVKNNFMPEFYYGSRKGAIGAYEQKAGNDYDIASLLIGVLRDKNIPARYARGEIRITAKQAMKWTGTKDPDVALHQIAALNIPATGLISEGELVAIRLEHVWVEAYVPYTNYRGTGGNTGKSLWVPLDPSFKNLTHINGVDMASLSDYVNNEDNFLTAESEMNGVNIGGIATEAEGQSSAMIKYLLENGYAQGNVVDVFGGREINQEEIRYLPIELPYTVCNNIDTFDDIPNSLTESITFTLEGGGLYDFDLGETSIEKQLYAPDIYGKNLLLNYVPATDSDKATIEKYGNIFKTPAYLFELKPELVLDGEVIAEGITCSAGCKQTYNIRINSVAPKKADVNVGNSVVVGGMYCIALDYGTISAEELQRCQSKIGEVKETLSKDNIYTVDAMGEILDSVAKSYFAQLDMYNKIIAGQKKVRETRELSVGIVGFDINVLYTFNSPAELNEGGIFLDIIHDVHSVVSDTNNKQDEKEFMLLSGIYSSAMEHGVLEQATGVESVSTIKAFEYAKQHNIPIHTITKENLSEELGKLSVNENVKQNISSSVQSNKIIVIPEKEITINQWSGVGYMVLDPDTFACGYMISGGLAGGSMTVDQMIDEYIDCVIQGLIFTLLWEIGTTIILALAPCGWVNAIKFIFNAAQIIMLLMAVYDMYMTYSMYQATGDVYYLQQLGIQVAAMATIGIASKLLGNKITKLKEKITQAIDEAGLKGKCFVAGTLIVSAMGLIPIEEIRANDMVYSFNSETEEVSQKRVEATFVRESQKLIKIQTKQETITCTPEHPFYVAKKGFVKALQLRAGDLLNTVNGEYVIVEKIQHEILENPVKVYNLRVAENHTYYVGQTGIGVHNAECGGTSGEPDAGEKTKPKKIDYKQIFFDQNPELEGKVVVHHSIEQQVLNKYPGLFTAEEINAYDMLRGIPKDVNSEIHLSKIRVEWNSFYKDVNAGKIPKTKESFLAKAKDIDSKYGSYFNPPK